MKEVWEKAKAFRTNSRPSRNPPNTGHLHEFANSYALLYVPEKQEILFPNFSFLPNKNPTSTHSNADFSLLPFTPTGFTQTIHNKKKPPPPCIK